MCFVGMKLLQSRHSLVQRSWTVLPTNNIMPVYCLGVSLRIIRLAVSIGGIDFSSPIALKCSYMSHAGGNCCLALSRSGPNCKKKLIFLCAWPGWGSLRRQPCFLRNEPTQNADLDIKTLEVGAGKLSADLSRAIM